MKQFNRQEIINFSAGINNSIQGTKLSGLFRLIQAKGEPMQTNDSKLNGVKVLNIGSGFYVGMIRAGQKDKFYPCMIKTILLETTIN